LMTVNASNNEPLPTNEIEWRVDQILGSGAREIDIWSSPIPDDWWPALNRFKQANKIAGK
jgi:hypothetical protein